MRQAGRPVFFFEKGLSYGNRERTFNVFFRSRRTCVRNKIIQHLEQIPKDVREQYKIVWEIPMKQLIDMAADRGAFICQSQSLNLWLEDPTYKSLTSMHFYSWKKGLKTGIYYLRRKPRAAPQQFTIDPSKTNNENNDDNDNEKNEGNVAEPEEPCEMCSA